jgi:subtilisin family serine protease
MAYDMSREWRLLLFVPFLTIIGGYGQTTVDLTIAGKRIHLTERPDIVAVRVVKQSEAIADNPIFSRAFDTIHAHSSSAGLLGIGKRPASKGAMPSGTEVFTQTNQTQQVRVYGTGSSNIDIALFPELIVQFKEGISDDVARQRLKIYGAQRADSTPVPGRYIVAMPQAESVVLATNNMAKNVPEVLYAEPNFYYIHRSAAAPMKPLATSAASGSVSKSLLANQWTLATTPIDFGIVHVWNSFGIKGAGVKVAIVDDGVDLDHEDLKDGISDFWDTTVPTPAGVSKQQPYSLQPNAYHGTACAGIVAARSADVGTVGVAPEATLIAIKAANYSVAVNGQPQWVDNTAALSDAIDKASAFDADVISSSWGMPNASTDVIHAIDRSLNGTNQRRILIFAAGNLERKDKNQSLTMDFPASLAAGKIGVIAVAASSPCDEIKSYTSCDNQTDWSSKYLPKPTVLAPGTTMATTIPGNQYAYFSGTSAATPFVAGVVALLMSKEPSLTRSQIVQRLSQFSRKLTVGVGSLARVDAYCLSSGTAACGP